MTLSMNQPLPFAEVVRQWTAAKQPYVKVSTMSTLVSTNSLSFVVFIVMVKGFTNHSRLKREPSNNTKYST